MTVDIEKMKALALAPMRATTAIKAEQALADFRDEANPAAVLELIAEVERMTDELVRLRDWFESQRKAISKVAGSTWDMCQCADQIERIEAVIGVKP